MSASKSEKLVRMANQIGDFFAVQPGPQAADGVASHLKKFWTPKMISEIVECASKQDSGLNLTAYNGVARLRGEPP